MPRKKKPTPRVRHSPYERALDRANARLTKAIAERDKCAEKLKTLTIEIPRLQDMIAGIERFMGVTRIEKEVKGVSISEFKADPYAPVWHGEKPVKTVKLVPDLTVDEFPDEADSLLPEVAGEELLP